MNDSNHTLRFSRTYQEATGKRVRRADFDAPTPAITGKGAAFWTLAVVALCITIYFWR